MAIAKTPEDLERVINYLRWAVSRALPSGVLAEQINPYTGAAISVSPLTWSHAAVVQTVMDYLEKLQELHTCEQCGRSIFRYDRMGRKQGKKHEDQAQTRHPPGRSVDNLKWRDRLFIYQRTRHEFTKEVREEAKLIAMELEITRNYLASALKASKLDITDQTKHFIPAVSGSIIGLKFAEKTGYVIKQTSIKYRNLFNKPDAFEEKVLREMEADPNLVEYWDSDVVDGKRVERYLYALHVKEDCLLCHGKKELAPEFIQNNYTAGYDYKAGELRGGHQRYHPQRNR